jgi:hypothetical protein
MDIVVKYVGSAFEHGCTEADIRNAINTWLYDDIWDEAVDKHLLLGFGCRHNLLEIMYNVIDEQTIKVFHAMKCRNVYIKLLKA